MFLIGVLFTLPLPLLAITPDGVCEAAEYSQGCCTGSGPFGQTGGGPPHWTTWNPNGGEWTSGKVKSSVSDDFTTKQFVRFDFDNDDRYCGGSNNKVQKGTAIFKMAATGKDKNVRISMDGVAEAMFEKYELFVDGKLEHKVQASNTKNVCWVSSCNMCNVNQPDKTFKLSGGSHEIKFAVTSIDPLFHNNCFFMISYEEDGCGGCKCTAQPTSVPTPTPTALPTAKPTAWPTIKDEIIAPTERPTKFPTLNPTNFPTLSPTNNPTWVPTPPPTKAGDCDPQPPKSTQSSAFDCKCKEVAIVVEQKPIIARAYCDKHVPHMESGQWRETEFCFVEESCADGKSFPSKELGNLHVAKCELPAKCSYEIPENCACKEVTDVYVFGSNVTTSLSNPMAKWLDPGNTDRNNPWQNAYFCVADENNTNCDALEQPDDLPFKIIRGKPTMMIEARVSATTPLLTVMIMVITYFKY